MVDRALIRVLITVVALSFVAGVAFALGIIAATLPLLRRITGPETARNE